MYDARKEADRYLAAAREIVDGRSPAVDRARIMVTLEGTVATVLVYLMGGDHRAAAEMLNEGLVPGVEGRIALGANRASNRNGG